jgi:hypothetical protein
VGESAIFGEGYVMSMSLANALHQVDLEAGRVYHCRIGRLRVEVRVEETASELLSTPLEASDVMLDPWTDLPAPQPVTVLAVTAGPPVLPDLPDLPTDEQP